MSVCVLFAFAEVLLPVGVLGHLGEPGLFPPLRVPCPCEGGAFELDIFPMGILLVWFVGGGWIVVWSLIVHTAVLTLDCAIAYV